MFCILMLQFVTLGVEATIHNEKGGALVGLLAHDEQMRSCALH
jgi:hypothetical protein